MSAASFKKWLASLPPVLWQCGWPLGAGAMLLQLAKHFVPMGERRDWAEYAVCGLIGGMALLPSLIAPQRTHPWLERAKTGLSFYALGALGVFLAHLVMVTSRTPRLDAICFAACVLVLAVLFGLFSCRRFGAGSGMPAPLFAGLMFGFYVFALLSASKLIYYLPLPVLYTHTLTKNPTTALGFSLLGYVAAALFSYAVLMCFTSRRPYNRRERLLLRLSELCALCVLAAFYFRTDIATFYFSTGLGDNPPYFFTHIQHNWKAVLEPAAAVRAGGWLLWDTPAQYGFFQPLVIALLPAQNLWQAFYIFNSLLLLACGFALFSLLYARHRTLAGYVFSLLVTLGCTTGIQSAAMIDHRLYPAGGPLRFCFIYAIIGWLILLYRRQGTIPRRFYAAGTLIWLFGVLWSVESAVYSSLLWIPGMAFFMLSHTTEIASPGMVIKAMLRSALYCSAWLLAAITCIAFYYHIRLGHFPDIRLYAAYAGAYAGGFFALPIYYYGACATLMFLFGLSLSVVKTYSCKVLMSGREWANAALLYAGLVTLWAASSYYISRSHDENILNILPVLVFACALILWLLPEVTLPRLCRHLYRGGMAAICGIIIFAGSELLTDKRVYAAWQPGYMIYPDITQLHYPFYGSASTLIEKIDPLGNVRIFVPDERFYAMTGHALTPWILPNTMTAYSVLPHAMVTELAARRAERFCEEGVIIESKKFPMEPYPWVTEALAQQYQKTGSEKIDSWKVTRYRKIGKGC